jgi:WD repeat and FYVE domain-containing protein 3
VDIESIEDPLQRNATLGFINNFGQIPAQLFKKPHPQRKIQQQSHNQGNPQSQSTVNSPTTIQIRPGLCTPKLFYHAPEQLRVSPKPVKELRAAIGEIVLNEKGNQVEFLKILNNLYTIKIKVIVLEENKLFIPSASYIAWGFYDRSIRFGRVGEDKSNCILETNNNAYEIGCMATADGRQVFAGLSTGNNIFIFI